MKVEIPDEIYTKWQQDSDGKENLVKFLVESMELYTRSKEAELRSLLREEGFAAPVLTGIGVFPIKIEAIRTIRYITGWCLRECKDAINKVENGIHVVIIPKAPQFTTLTGAVLSVSEGVDKIRSSGYVVKYNIDPSAIVRIRKDYGVIGSRVLKEIMELNG